MHGKQIDKFLRAEYFMRSIMERARPLIAPYQDPAVGAPDPSFILQLPDENAIGSNLYGVQKFFDGPFQFDVYFDSASVKQHLTRK